LFFDLPHKLTAVVPLPAGKVQQKSNAEDTSLLDMMNVVQHGGP
jgi:hypothetical protein